MGLFDHLDYRSYVREAVAKQPRGELTKIANHLRVNTTLISQVMSGERDFSVKQGLELNRYFAHSDLESDYFLLLIQLSRSGTEALRSHWRKKIEDVRGEAKKLSRQVRVEKSLSETERSIFYSSWFYSAVHLFTSVGKGVTADQIASRFQVPKQRALEALRFLEEAGLVQETKNVYKMSVGSTFLEKGSPHLLKHHANWRVRAIQKSETLTDDEMMFTGQVSISREDFQYLREQLAGFLKTAAEKVKDSPAEELACLNLDWFWI